MIETRFWVASALSLALFFIFSYFVRHAPWSTLDARGMALRGRLTPLAVIFTLSGRVLPLVTLGVLATALFAALRASVLIPLGISAAQIASQGAVVAFKSLFGRLRPDYWLVGKELGLSYPSGHACTAIVFFGSWAVVIGMSPLPRVAKVALIALILIWMLGIDFSRLALGAHYVTDIMGGTLLGLTFLFAMLALSQHFHVVTRTFGEGGI